MARAKEFDLERALHRAISAFSQKGFAATSTEELMSAMQLGRQSMYDTFGDKRALFLTSIRRILPLWMPPNAVLTGSGRML